MRKPKTFVAHLKPMGGGYSAYSYEFCGKVFKLGEHNKVVGVSYWVSRLRPGRVGYHVYHIPKFNK